MGTTISVTAFQTACAAIADAIIAKDRDTAYTQLGVAEAINAGLEVSVADTGSSIQRRDSLRGLRETLEATFSAITSNSETSRFILGRTNFQ